MLLLCFAVHVLLPVHYPRCTSPLPPIRLSALLYIREPLFITSLSLLANILHKVPAPRLALDGRAERCRAAPPINLW